MKYLKEYKIFEYLKKDENIWLYQYFKMSDEDKKNSLPHDFPWFFKDFLVEEDIVFKMPTHDYTDADGEQTGEEYEEYEVMEWLYAHNRDLFNKFAEYLYKKVKDNELNIPDADYPAWSFFGSPEILKEQWLIHVTDNADAIESEGFTKGMDQIEKLGLTTNFGDYHKKHGGYNFAYTLYDFKRYAKTNRGWVGGYKYGKEIILFRCSGVRIQHYSDEEYQTIFWGKLATNINKIDKGEKCDWGIFNKISGRLLYENDELENVIHWVVRNYNQYKKYLY
jgi:hypothetical protein